MPRAEPRLRARLLQSWLLLFALLAGPAWAEDAGIAKLPKAPAVAVESMAPRIGVVTMEPGQEFWERFGHDAILVSDPVSGQALSYNFGFFDMGEPGFYGNFIRGHMQYYLVALPAAEDLANYQAVGRGVSVQWLAFEPAQARKLAAALADNALPENARYRYEYFTDNCSTRVRDALDGALDGILRAQLSGRSQGNTFRSESVRLAWPAKWMAFGFHLGMSGYGDRPLSRWEESFVPMRLRDALREVKRADGQPLVQAEEVLLPHLQPVPPAELPRWRVQALLAGLSLGLLVAWLGPARPRALAALAIPFWLLCSLAGSLMLYLWLGTAHVAAHGNENMLLFSPLALLLLPGALRLARGKPASRFFENLLWVMAGSAAIAGFLRFLPFLPQENVEWVLLLLPIHLALARVFSPRR